MLSLSLCILLADSQTNLELPQQKDSNQMVAYVRFENCIFTSNLISMQISPTVSKKLMDFRCISEAAAALHRGGFGLPAFRLCFVFVGG